MLGALVNLINRIELGGAQTATSRGASAFWLDWHGPEQGRRRSFYLIVYKRPLQRFKRQIGFVDDKRTPDHFQILGRIELFRSEERTDLTGGY